MRFLRKLLCDHSYTYKCSMRSDRPFTPITASELVFRCTKCDKHKSVDTTDISDYYRYFIRKGCAGGHDDFKFRVPSYLYVGNEAYAVYSRYLRKGIDLTEVSK